MKKLIKSYRFWTALAGAVGLLVVNIAKLFGYVMSSVVVEELIMAICGVLVVFGIVVKPEEVVVKTETSEKDKQESDTTPTQEETTNAEQEQTTKDEK